MKEHLFDKRVVKRALQEGLLNKDEYQRMLDALPDLSHKLQTEADEDLDDDDDDDLDGSDEPVSASPESDLDEETDGDSPPDTGETANDDSAQDGTLQSERSEGLPSDF